MKVMFPITAFYFRFLLVLLFSCILSFDSFSKSSSFLIPKSEFSKDTLPNSDSLDDKVFEQPEVPAIVDKAAWIKHLEMGLKDVIINAARSGMENGKYTINVRFVVERDGSISNIQALNDPGFGTKKAVEKIVRTGPKWKSAEINEKKVRSFKTQPITFMIFR